jgi:hypothetical protein
MQGFYLVLFFILALSLGSVEAFVPKGKNSSVIARSTWEFFSDQGHRMSQMLVNITI